MRRSAGPVYDFGDASWYRRRRTRYQAALEAANKVRMLDAEFMRYYQFKFKEVPKHQHRRALALTARKLVRLLYSLLYTSRLYILFVKLLMKSIFSSNTYKKDSYHFS